MALTLIYNPTAGPVTVGSNTVSAGQQATYNIPLADQQAFQAAGCVLTAVYLAGSALAVGYISGHA
jgi:hypothetical protein